MNSNIWTTRKVLLGLSNFFLKIVSPTISEQLCQIFNKCNEEECFPNLLKIGIMIPIHEEGTKNEAGNYRPISSLSVVGKLFEKLLHKRFLDFLIKHQVLSGRQLCFLSKRSTVEAMIETFEALLERKQQHKPFQCFLLDLSKAIDTVDHRLLPAKCERYGLRGTVGRLLGSFLSNRKQFGQFSDNSLNMRDITHGVTQGSVLGPFLFLLYINDLLTIVRNCEITLFADDTKIFLNYNENSSPLVKLNKISEWMKNSKLTLNEAKTQFLSVETKSWTTRLFHLEKRWSSSQNSCAIFWRAHWLSIWLQRTCKFYWKTMRKIHNYFISNTPISKQKPSSTNV